MFKVAEVILSAVPASLESSFSQQAPRAARDRRASTPGTSRTKSLPDLHALNQRR